MSTQARIRLTSSGNVKAIVVRSQNSNKQSSSTQVKSSDLHNYNDTLSANYHSNSHASLPHYPNRILPKSNFQSLTQLA